MKYGNGNYGLTAVQCEGFYKGAAHSEELQNKLDLMKSWDAKRLAAAVPSWAKCKMLPPTFKPQLSQKFPSWTVASTNCRCTRTQADFYGLDANDPAAYILEWERHFHLKPVNVVRLEERIAA